MSGKYSELVKGKMGGGGSWLLHGSRRVRAAEWASLWRGVHWVQGKRRRVTTKQKNQFLGLGTTGKIHLEGSTIRQSVNTQIHCGCVQALYVVWAACSLLRALSENSQSSSAVPTHTTTASTLVCAETWSGPSLFDLSRDGLSSTPLWVPSTSSCPERKSHWSLFVSLLLEKEGKCFYHHSLNFKTKTLTASMPSCKYKQQMSSLPEKPEPQPVRLIGKWLTAETEHRERG